MFISALPSSAESCTDSPSLPAPRTVRSRKLAETTKGFARELAYRFDAISDLLSVCRRLSRLGYEGESHAYCDERGGYLLFLSIISPSPFSIPEEYSFLMEYGSIEMSSIQKTYLCEHGHEIAKRDAVHLLARLA